MQALMLSRGQIIKHKNSMDVAFEIINFYEATECIKFEGRWLNQGHIESWYLLSKSSNIKLPKSELKNILYCVDQTVDICLRKCEWASLK